MCNECENCKRLRAIIEQDNVEPDCDYCNGIGEATYMAGAGPDAYEELASCHKCGGTGIHPPKDSTETADSDFENKVIVDKSDLFDFVRGAIKDALDHDAEEERNEAHLWSDAHDRTVECLTKVYGSENPEPASKDCDEAINYIINIREKLAVIVDIEKDYREYGIGGGTYTYEALREANEEFVDAVSNLPDSVKLKITAIKAAAPTTPKG